MVIDISQFNETYLEEATEHLGALETGLLELEKTGEGDLNAIFRAAHSIKGGAGTFGFMKIANFTHNLEGVLDKAREGELPITPPLSAILLQAVDVLREMIDAARSGEEVDDDCGVEVSKELNSYLVGEASDNGKQEVSTADSSDGIRCVNISFKPSPHLLQTGSDPLNIFRELSSLGNINVTIDKSGLPSLKEFNPESLYYSWQIALETEVGLDDIKDVFLFVEDDADIEYQEVNSGERKQVEEILELTPLANRRDDEDRRQGDRRQASTQKETAPKETAFIRVETGKVDQLINLVGELVTTGAMVSQHSQELEKDGNDSLHKVVAEMSHHTRNMQEAIMAIRMMPVSFVFNRFPRMVRDTATKLGKNVELITEGENTELDKTVIERIVDPLTHLVRNSVDHGIEMPDEREESGKPAIATVALSASYQGGNVIIKITDDGKGLNRETILAKAIDKGMANADDNYSDEDVWQFIFEPGFSTAVEVTDVSGRGVGMDVVRRNIQSLGGTIRIESIAGEGSTFTISLPLTLAILDGMAIDLSGVTYIIPILNIIESTRPTKDTVRTMRNNLEVMDFRGEYLPFVRLKDIFLLPSETPIEQGIAIIVEAENQQFALFIDDLLGERQVVIKSIEQNYKMVEGISGATILGDGSVSLILDLAAIMRKATREGLLNKGVSPDKIQGINQKEKVNHVQQ